jgi:23S rRNA-/tRNA-specific pseudouridylate synthase
VARAGERLTKRQRSTIKEPMREPFGLEAEPRLVHVDDRVLVVRKPCRMHSIPGASEGDLCAWVFERFPDAAFPEGERGAREGGILHRLDYETSGLVLFARDREAKAFLEEEQGKGRILKEYRAGCAPSDGLYPRGSNPPRSTPTGIDPRLWLVALAVRSGDAPKTLAGMRGEDGDEGCDKATRLAALLSEASVDGRPIYVECRFRSFGSRGGSVACVGAGGEELSPSQERRLASTRRRLASKGRLYRTSIFSVRQFGDGLELNLGISLGFRHQIRAQLAWIGLPILGDGLYGGLPAERLHLHAAALVFRHPEGGSELRVAD